MYNDLPEEGEVDFTWCDRYELAEDQRTWNIKQQAEDESVDDADTEDSTAEESQQSEQPSLIVVATLPFRQRVLAQFIGDGEYLYHVDAGQKNEIVRLEMDTDDAYAQNLLLAAENVEAFKKAIEHDIHKVVNAVKKVFPVDGKRPELATVIQFLAVWFKTEYIDRGLPNEVYHAANGISSTQVKDARVSLMYFNARHVAKTIRRETSEALTFGTLVHALALEPECFDAEFAVFPGVPDGAFTNTESLKAFIREHNEGKDKSEQLKLTGTKDVLSAAIRAVKPDAIFADEFEQQWNEANQNKIILSERQLAHAKAIQQALFNHPSAGQLLQHPNRANEVSYFGMDEDTGLEVRVRPDLEIDMSGVRIGVDLKTISLGKVKQDFLRAKLHREIIERDYHLSAGMYCDVADFNQFFWIFVNKDEGYHWVAIIEASDELLELGRMEYRKAMNAISNALDTNVWPAPITEDYTDELNDFDLRRLEALRTQA
ncbi:TPA: PD-(D/E)XK nuclease-like domain-containing protein [Citrobacter gillenii]|nr:PD-(D/E)XK nuclease-like domain-containing protein [Citrobacter gillenii]HEE0108431.1 PD-(D/E)XK nuclease-like domain-containing protein [Citrobacter gillenii]HEE0108491.1 PD-(D/E)XK nuclease-like domain-containing protein [Citrobacter gillenii]